MNTIKILIIALFLIPLSGFSQDGDGMTNKEKRQNRTAYRGLSYGGLGIGSLRDFATSPLTYTGISIIAGGFKITGDEERETRWGTPLSVGFFGTNFNDHSSLSTVITISPYYSELYRLKALSSDKLNVKAGGMLQATVVGRINPDLQNNSLGLEIIPTLFGSIKGTLDVSRTADTDKKFLFLRFKREKREKALGLRVNIGLVNASYRNGFVYSGQSFLLDEPQVFDDYQFKVFQGFRMSSSLDYTLHSRKTTNAVQISYVWDALTTGGDSTTFELAQHGLRFTLLFNTK